MTFKVTVKRRDHTQKNEEQIDDCEVVHLDVWHIILNDGLDLNEARSTEHLQYSLAERRQRVCPENYS